MKTVWYSTIVALILLLLSGGCAPSSRITADAHQAIPVEVRITPEVTVEKAEAIRHDGKVLVKGNLRRPWGMRLDGQVKVIFLGAEGSLLAEEQIPVTAKSRRRGFQSLPFSKKFDLQLPMGARAVIFYHAPISGTQR